MNVVMYIIQNLLKTNFNGAKTTWRCVYGKNLYF